MNSSGDSVLGGLGFRRAEVFSKPRMGEFWGWNLSLDRGVRAPRNRVVGKAYGPHL